MRIYLSSRVLRPKQSGGIVAYFLGLVEALAARPGDADELHVGVTELGTDFRTALSGAMKMHHLPGAFGQEQADAERELIERLKPDWVIYFVADPLNYYGRGEFGVACCIADLQHLHWPFFFPAGDRVARDQAFANAVEHSDFLFTLSKFCQGDITAAYNLPERKVRVVYPAVRGQFHGSAATANEVSEVRSKHRLPEHYALFPANYWRHKNHARLLAAFARWRSDAEQAAGDQPPPHLVLVGSEVGRNQILRRLLREGRQAGWLSTPGFVSDRELHALVSGARCLVFPSLFEGFGIPVLEALAMGRPVASSNCTSLPEVGGDLPHYFDPLDEAAMLRALTAAWSPTPDASFPARARAQAGRFQYAKSAGELRAALDLERTSAPLERRARVRFVDEPPLVSIVTPSYQHAPFLKQCIDSVLGQDYPRIEYAVFDGGSSDSTVEILRSYGDRFHWQSAPDGGQTNAINLGLRRAQGEIHAYLNSDDFLLPGAVSAVVEAWRRQPSVDVFYGRANWTDEAGQITSPYPTAPFNADAFRGDCFICQPACFWRRRVTEHFGLFDESYQFAMDYEYWQRVLAGGGVLCLLDQFLACSRLHEATKTRSQRGRVFKDIFASQWQIWGSVHEDWWLGLLHHLADERKGVWPRLIPSRSRSRIWLSRRLARWVRKPFPRRAGR